LEKMKYLAMFESVEALILNEKTLKKV